MDSDSFTANSCRICLKVPGLISVFDKLDNHVIADSILKITGVHIDKRSEYDRSPKVCGNCLQSLQAAKNLRASAEESDSLFKYKFGVMETKKSEPIIPLTIVKVKKLETDPFWEEDPDPDYQEYPDFPDYQDYPDKVKRFPQKSNESRDKPSSDRSKVSRKLLENEESRESNKTRKTHDPYEPHFISDRHRKSHDPQNHSKVSAVREEESDEEWENSNNDSRRSIRRPSEKSSQNSSNVQRIKKTFEKPKEKQENPRYVDDIPKVSSARVQNEEELEFNEEWVDHPSNNERRASRIPSEKSQCHRRPNKDEDADYEDDYARKVIRRGSEKPDPKSSQIRSKIPGVKVERLDIAYEEEEPEQIPEQKTARRTHDPQKSSKSRPRTSRDADWEPAGHEKKIKTADSGYQGSDKSKSDKSIITVSTKNYEEHTFVCTNCLKTFSRNYELGISNKNYELVCKYCSNKLPKSSEGQENDGKSDAKSSKLNSLPVPMNSKEKGDHLKEVSLKNKKENTMMDSLFSLENKGIKERIIKTEDLQIPSRTQGVLPRIKRVIRKMPAKSVVKKNLFICDKCGIKIAKKLDMEYHLLAVHQKIPQYIRLYEETVNSCHTCHQIFPSKFDLADHQKCHCAQQFICKYCTRIFSIRNSYQRHLQRHMGKFKYICNLCQKGFSEESHLKNHEEKHKNGLFNFSWRKTKSRELIKNKKQMRKEFIRYPPPVLERKQIKKWPDRHTRSLTFEETESDKEELEESTQY